MFSVDDMTEEMSFRSYHLAALLIPSLGKKAIEAVVSQINMPFDRPANIEFHARNLPLLLIMIGQIDKALELLANPKFISYRDKLPAAEKKSLYSRDFFSLGVLGGPGLYNRHSIILDKIARDYILSSYESLCSDISEYVMSALRPITHHDRLTYARVLAFREVTKRFPLSDEIDIDVIGEINRYDL